MAEQILLSETKNLLSENKFGKVKRRKFLKQLGIGAAAATVAPTILSEIAKNPEPAVNFLDRRDILNEVVAIYEREKEILYLAGDIGITSSGRNGYFNGKDWIPMDGGEPFKEGEQFAKIFHAMKEG